MGIKCRVGQAKQMFVDIRNLLCARNLELHVRKHLLKCYDWSVLLYGSESWTINRIYGTKLEATEMWFWRKIIRISYKDILKNEVVLEMVGAERQFLTTMRRRQWKFIGHEFRGLGIERNILEAAMSRKGQDEDKD